jgi:hypothetical protein
MHIGTPGSSHGDEEGRRMQGSWRRPGGRTPVACGLTTRHSPLTTPLESRCEPQDSPSWVSAPSARRSLPSCSRSQELRERYSLEWSLVGVAAPAGGGSESARPRSPVHLRAGQVSPIPGGPVGGDREEDSVAFVRQCGADVFFENTPVNYADGEPAVSTSGRLWSRGCTPSRPTRARWFMPIAR